MTVRELIEHLQKLEHPECEIMILDGFNGGGHPRDINYHPSDLHNISEDDAEATADCEDREGEPIYVLGYGFY